MLITLYRCASAGQRSVSTFKTIARDAISEATFFTSGAAIRHGPHHSAQKSTSTGTRAARTMLSKVSGSVSIGSAIGGSSALHAPQRPASARCSGGTRLLFPQAGHFRIIHSVYRNRSQIGAVTSFDILLESVADPPPCGLKSTGAAALVAREHCRLDRVGV